MKTFTDGCADDGQKPESLVYYLLPHEALGSSELKTKQP